MLMRNRRACISWPTSTEHGVADSTSALVKSRNCSSCQSVSTRALSTTSTTRRRRSCSSAEQVVRLGNQSRLWAGVVGTQRADDRHLQTARAERRLGHVDDVVRHTVELTGGRRIATDLPALT
jgi:hypothetical protein